MTRAAWLLLFVLVMVAVALRIGQPALAIMLLAVLLAAALAWLVGLYLQFRARRAADRRLYFRPPDGDNCCLCIPPKYWKTPDPFLYDQFHLLKQGLAVTWDNPDIWLEENGHRLTGNPQPDTDYEIVVRVWNASFEAPAFNCGLEFFVADFGAGAPLQPIGSTNLSVIQVRGLPPASARMHWRTPAATGHHCILVRLRPPADADFDNNEGQENLQIVAAQRGQQVSLVLPVHNPSDRELGFTIEANTYRTSSPEDVARRAAHSGIVTSKDAPDDITFRPVAELRANEARAHNARDGFAVPESWQMRQPGPGMVPPRSRIDVACPFTLPADIASGRHPVTLMALTTSGVPHGGATFLLEVA